MPVESSQVLVGTTRVKIVVPRASNQKVIVHDHDHSGNKEVFIGDSTVTTTTGLHIPKTETIQFDLVAGDDLWAISNTAGGAELHVMVIRN